MGWSLLCNKLKLQTVKVELDAKVFVDLTLQNSSTNNVTSSPIADFSKANTPHTSNKGETLFFKKSTSVLGAEEGELYSKILHYLSTLVQMF